MVGPSVGLCTTAEKPCNLSITRDSFGGGSGKLAKYLVLCYASNLDWIPSNTQLILIVKSLYLHLVKADCNSYYISVQN